MKLCVMIPAYNEATTIGEVIKRIPSKIDSMKVSILVIDDGSIDGTAEAARKVGAHAVISHKKYLPSYPT